MTCPRCNGLVPDGYLACPGCATTQGFEALLRYQHHPLRAVVTGTALLITRRTRTGAKHLQVFGEKAYGQWTYCGEPVESGSRRELIKLEGPPFALLDSPLLCRKCATVVGRLIKEAFACSA